ncbi:MAG: tetratricopeptide repeat protein [Rhodospirillales bacterium]|nr:tetratricopeptide repeat protein [Rhodospirillales bacterium]
MTALTARLGEALRRHQAGDFSGAEALYRTVLAEAPANTDALHLLGLLAYQRGRHHEAAAAIAQAVVLRPDAALYRINLARISAAAGNLAGAENSFRAARALDPANADIHYDLGLVLARLGRQEEAAQSYRAAIRLAPEYAAAHNNLASALDALGRPEEAEFHYRAAIACQPHLAEPHANLGALLSRLGRPEEAQACLRQALALAPDFPEALNTLGTVLAARGELAAAEAASRQALALDPAYAEAHNNLGVQLFSQGRFEESLSTLATALRLKPRYAEAETNIANTLVTLGRLDEAESAYRRALAIAPDEPETRYNLGVALLLAGRLLEGWTGYEWRWKRRGAASRDLSQPLWSGEPLGERVLLVHAEQGFGDTIQFCRFVPLLGARHVMLEVPQPISRLLSKLRGVERLVVRGEALPPFDLHCPLMSLPHRLGTTLKNMPAETPYLAADPGEVAGWQARLAGRPGLKVGLAWAGNPEFPADSRRSIDPALLAPLLSTPSVQFVSLQPAPPPPELPLLAFPGELTDFADTAALIAALDLVIGVDTAVVHLAGALAKPVWLLNRFDPCWRWLLDRTDSPWYPTLRQFRQKHPGDWPGVIAAVQAALPLALDDPRHLMPTGCSPTPPHQHISQAPTAPQPSRLCPAAPASVVPHN